MIALLVSVTLISCKESDDFISKNTILLDTIVSIKIYDDDIKEETLDEIIAYISTLEEKLSFTIEGSDIWQINENNGSWVNVSKETIELIKMSIEISQLSDGLFDISSGPLINLWGISPPEGYYPTTDEIDEAIEKINYKNIEIDETNQKVKIQKHMNINLGAIAKGYIADKVKVLMTEKSIDHGIINLGGNVLLIGNKPSGKLFEIGVAKPYALRGELVATIKIEDVAMVSSGIYERYFEYEDKKYHHILNPLTGYPENNTIQSVSIITDSSGRADALSTAIFLLGVEKGLAVIEADPTVEVVFVTKANKIIPSSGLKDIITVVSDSGYELI